jgi:signal transduction histidine kinase
MKIESTDNLIGYLKEVVLRASQAQDETAIDDVLGQCAAEIRERINCERLQAATRLAGWLAHRINNPLGAISGNAQLLARRLERDIEASESLETYMRYVDAIQAQTERSAGITSELLEFTRSRDVLVRDTDIPEVLQEAVTLVGYTSGRSNMVVDTDSSGDLSIVRTDSELLIQALYEVILNAAQAAGEDGAVTVKATPVADASNSLEWIRIAVADTGPGIAEDVLPRVFDPFFSTREKARGLGLTSSLAIVRQLGGTIAVGETGPNGTVVTIEIPTGRQ